MTSKFTKLFALALISAFMLVNVQAKTALMGRLKTRDNKPVSVNGHKATSGTTLMSGSEVQCPDNVGATVDLGALGRVDMAPNSSMTLVFNATEVSVQLKAGYVVLTTNKGIAGVVNTADGGTFQTNGSSVVAKMKSVTGPEAAASAGATSGGLGTGAVVGIAGAGAAVVGGAAAAKASGRGSNLSTDNPRNQ